MNSLYSSIAARLQRGAHNQTGASGLIIIAAIAMAVTGCDQQAPTTPKRTAVETPAHVNNPSTTMLGLAAQQNGGQNLGAKLPIIDLPRKYVCTGIEYIDAKGTILKGGKPCSVTNCRNSGQFNCKVTDQFKAVDLSKITFDLMHKDGNIAGKPGTYDPDSFTKCKKTGQENCYVEGTMMAIAKTKLHPGMIKAGKTVGLLVGAYPSDKYPMPPPNGGNRELDSDSVKGMFGDQHNTYYFWARSGDFQTIKGDANMIPKNIIRDKTVLNVKGSTPAPTATECTGPGQKACIIKKDDKTLVAVDTKDISVGKIKAGVKIGSITGQYPSDKWPLKPGEAVPDLDLTSGFGQFQSDAKFGFFTAAGEHVVARGEDGLRDPENIKKDVTIWGVKGTFGGVNYGDIKPWDVRKGIQIPNTSKTGTLDLAQHCSSADDCLGDDKPWQDVTKQLIDGVTEGCAEGTDKPCVFRSRVQMQDWLFHPKRQPTNWETSAKYCKGLNHGGQKIWRMPTQKEVMSAAALGMGHLRHYTSGYYDQRTDDKGRAFWTATAGNSTQMNDPEKKLHPDADFRIVYVQDKDERFKQEAYGNSAEVVCVRSVPKAK